MAKRVGRGDIWLLELQKPDKRRPVLVLSREALLDQLTTATVVAITSTFRGSPTEIAVGVAEGLKQESCVNLTNFFTVRQDRLHRYVGTVGPAKMHAVCRALAISVGCDQ